MRRIWLVLLAVLVTGCGSAQAAHPRGESSAPATTASQAAYRLPSGWRWESYHGVAVAVPDDFGEGSTDQLLTQWCVNGKKASTVGRPGASTLVLCRDLHHRAAYQIQHTGPVVAFRDAKRPGGRTSSKLDRVTVTLGRVQVVVQVPTGLRQKILATIHRTGADDDNGCPLSDPISAHPTRRPPNPLDVRELTGVTTISACKYPLHVNASFQHSGLFSALRLTGVAARSAIARIAALPVGSGPNAPQDCAASYEYGDEAIVLRVDSDQGSHEIYLRYAGCDHHGFDDGVAVRRLGRAAVAPFVAGPNRVQSWNANLGPILGPR